MTTITIQAKIHALVEKVWKSYTSPKDVMRWNNASEEWHTPKAENDLRVGGKFVYRMEAKDKSIGFDFSGVYDEVKKNEVIAFTIGDGRKVRVIFRVKDETEVVITFEAESTNSIEMQREGWQSILNNFKKYVENN